MTRICLPALILVIGVTDAGAQVVNTYKITPQEQADCQMDAAALCSSVYPDQDKLIGCMRANEDNLSPRCRKTFTTGLARRHL